MLPILHTALRYTMRQNTTLHCIARNNGNTKKLCLRTYLIRAA